MNKYHKLWYQSSYDRGLDILLWMWPKILEQIPNATLDICYGWDLFDKAYHNNPERMSWKEQVVELMKQPGITHHGKIGQDKMKELRKQCGIWAYPTYFTEISCIGALECQKDGLVPVVINLAALNETVQSGIKIDGDVFLPEVRKQFISELINLMNDPKRCEEESLKGQEFAKQFTWERISKIWKIEFDKK